MSSLMTSVEMEDSVTGNDEQVLTGVRVEADDAPDALAELLTHYPMADPTVRYWKPEIDAIGVLIRAWMKAHPDMVLELTLSKLPIDKGGCVFDKRRPEPLPTDSLVETILAVTQVDDQRQTMGLDGKLWDLFAKIYALGAKSDERQVAVQLTPHSLIIGGRLIWIKH